VALAERLARGSRGWRDGINGWPRESWKPHREARSAVAASTVGVVPGMDRRIANTHVDVAIASGMAHGAMSYWSTRRRGDRVAGLIWHVSEMH